MSGGGGASDRHPDEPRHSLQLAVVDISAAATITIPDQGDRYVSVMVVNQDHYVKAIHHAPGAHRMTIEDHSTPHVVVAVRILVDPADGEDVAAVTRLQDRFELTAGSSNPFTAPEYEASSFNRTRYALLGLAADLTAFDRTFGAKNEVDPVRHLIGTAAGWGGLPTRKATHIGVTPDLPAGTYELKVRDVPVDGFWSISVYRNPGRELDLSQAHRVRCVGS